MDLLEIVSRLSYCRCYARAYKGRFGKVGEMTLPGLVGLRALSTSGIDSRYPSSTVVSIIVGWPILGSLDRLSFFHIFAVAMTGKVSALFANNGGS